MPKNPIHAASLNKIFLFFFTVLQKSFQIRKKDPITIFNSEPEPDISIVEYRDDAYSSAHPTSAHLVIEVANTSLALDREKCVVYANGKIPEYWIINLNELDVEVYREPDGKKFKSKKIYSKDDIVIALFSSQIKFKLSEFI